MSVSTAAKKHAPVACGVCLALPEHVAAVGIEYT